MAKHTFLVRVALLALLSIAHGQLSVGRAATRDYVRKTPTTQKPVLQTHGTHKGTKTAVVPNEPSRPTPEAPCQPNKMADWITIAPDAQKMFKKMTVKQGNMLIIMANLLDNQEDLRNATWNINQGLQELYSTMKEIGQQVHYHKILKEATCPWSGDIADMICQWPYEVVLATMALGVILSSFAVMGTMVFLFRLIWAACYRRSQGQE